MLLKTIFRLPAQNVVFKKTPEQVMEEELVMEVFEGLAEEHVAFGARIDYKTDREIAVSQSISEKEIDARIKLISEAFNEINIYFGLSKKKAAVTSQQGHSPIELKVDRSKPGEITMVISPSADVPRAVQS